MSKRPATEDLDAMEDVASPAPKKFRSDGEESLDGRMAEMEKHMRALTPQVSEPESRPTDEGEDEDDAPGVVAPIRQAAPTAGYDDLYLDSIDRHVLDFDFEKLCSVSLSNINVYACLVCGRYYQGRGPKSHAYFHALDEDHHVFINMQTQHVYVLPEGYEVLSRSLDDIKFVADPRYTRADVARLDRGRNSEQGPCYTLTGKTYTPGFVGMNNIKENDYLNVIVQALAHVPPLRNFFLLDEFGSGAALQKHKDGKAKDGALTNTNAELVKRFGLLVRKIWNPRAFKAHVSPHELLQEVALRSNRRFTLTAQSDPVDFLTWFLNNLHLGLGGSRTRPGSSIIQRVFQGRVRVKSEKLEAVGAAAAAAAAAAATAAAAAATEAESNSFSSEMQIDTPFPVRPGIPPQQQHQMPPPPGFSGTGYTSFNQPPPPGMSMQPPPFAGPPGMSSMGSSASPMAPPPLSSLSPPPSSSPSAAPTSAQAARAASLPPKPDADVSRFLLLTLDLPPAPLFQDEQERNIIPQVPLATLLEKYDGQSSRDQGDVRRRFRLRGPLPPYLVLHMKRFSANKFVTERNPTIVTFDPRGLDMRPYVEDEQGNSLKKFTGDEDEDDMIYDLVANVVHEAVRARSDDVAVDSAEERRTWKVQLRDRSGATSSGTTADDHSKNSVNNNQDKWVVAQDLFVEPVAGELLYLAESYIQIWERRKRPAPGPASHGTKGRKAVPVNGGSKN